MKAKLLILLMFINLSVFGQVNVHIPNGGSIATQEMVKAYFDSWLQRYIQGGGVIIPPVIIDPEAPACPAGFAINSISAISKTSLRATITGTGVSSFNWKIYQSSPSVVLKSGNVPSFSTINNVAWSGELAPGNYFFRIEAVNCTASSTMAFSVLNVTDPNNPPACTSSPVIGSITQKSQTSLTFTFSGLNVSEMLWSITQNGNTIRTGSIIPGAATTITVNYSSISIGTYKLELKGLGCTGVTLPREFILEGAVDPNTPPPAGERIIYMNTTGFGFDPNSPTGINTEFYESIEAFNHMNYNGVAFSGINGVRINMKWYDYEPTEGVYNDQKLLAAVEWLKQHGLKTSICMVPWRYADDGMIPENEMATLQNGTKWCPYCFLPIRHQTAPSMHSTISRQRFRNTVKHMAQVMKSAYPDWVDYISCVTAQTEEFQLLREENPIQMSGYSQADRDAWNSYSGGLPLPIPSVSGMPNSACEQYGTEVGKKWYEFQTNGLAAFHASFIAGVKEGGMRACGMYAGAGAPSAVYDYSMRLNRIFAGSDIIYSSEGDRQGQWAKLMATDLNAGTFPAANWAIEFDPDDLSQSQEVNPPYGTPLNGALLWQYGSAFFNRGGKIIHFAMQFSSGNIPHLSEALYRLQTEYVKSATGYTPLPQGTPFNAIPTNPCEVQYYRSLWSQGGGGTTMQVKFRIMDQESPLNPNPPTQFTLGSQFIPEGKQIRIFLPANYSLAKQYPVLYMMDGQTIFSEQTPGEGEWHADETTQSLINSGQIRETIIVGISSGAYRFREYFPEDVWPTLTQDTRNLITTEYNGTPLGNQFLRFLIEELKPKIDAEYSVLTDQQNTFIGGSSMGGLISAYAICKYPNIFKGNISMSTHWLGSLIHRETEFPARMREWINSNSPSSSNHKLYFDYGTESLDSYYEQYQIPVDGVLQPKGYNSSNYRSLKFQGAGHSIADWGARFQTPMLFQFGI